MLDRWGGVFHRRDDPPVGSLHGLGCSRRRKRYLQDECGGGSPGHLARQCLSVDAGRVPGGLLHRAERRASRGRLAAEVLLLRTFELAGWAEGDDAWARGRRLLQKRAHLLRRRLTPPGHRQSLRAAGARWGSSPGSLRIPAEPLDGVRARASLVGSLPSRPLATRS